MADIVDKLRKMAGDEILIREQRSQRIKKFALGAVRIRTKSPGRQ
jgi:hypothetical protein